MSGLRAKAYLVLGWFMLLACLLMFACAAAIVAGCRGALPS